MAALSRREITSRLRTMPGWEYDGQELSRDFKFGSFKEAMFFANAVAGIAEMANHHPEIDINYDKVEIDLRTHSEDGVTEKDFAAAAQIDAAARVLAPRATTKAAGTTKPAVKKTATPAKRKSAARRTTRKRARAK